MKTPPSKLLLSAISIVGTRGISETDFNIFVGNSMTYGFGFEDYARALNFLLHEGTLQKNGGVLKMTGLKNQTWLSEAVKDGDFRSWELMDSIPSRMWKHDPDDLANAELGLIGELFVVEQLKSSIDEDLHEQIEHVSIENDALGYDIKSPSVYEARGTVRIEVKTSSRPGNQFNFFLSRNEFDVGNSTQNWYVVFVKIVQGNPNLVGHLGVADLVERVSRDVESSFTWQSLRGELDIRELTPGLP